ncbi:MAG: hypothetical protein EOM50_15050 [Erysipelotrichia bacterium]|nr:hypothetical protein [Erysipelotrichia bacterium]
MEQLSRVKKYENLRSTIENETVSMPNAETAIKEISKSKESVKEYTPTHEKESFFNEPTKKDDLDNTFKNEYLDSFIQEVRDYNMKKGVREYEDTKLDILQQLSSKNREKRSNYVERIDDKEKTIDNNRNVSEETMEISKQVFELLDDDVQAEKEVSINESVKTAATNEIQEEPVKFAPVLEKNVVDADATRMSSELEARIASLESQLVETTQQLKVQNKKEELESFSKRELAEETMKLKVQMNEYKDELDDLNDGVDSNNRLLNIIITILIVALLGVIGMVVYWLISGGII